MTSILLLSSKVWRILINSVFLELWIGQTLVKLVSDSIVLCFDGGYHMRRNVKIKIFIKLGFDAEIGHQSVELPLVKKAVEPVVLVKLPLVEKTVKQIILIELPLIEIAVGS